MQLRLRTKLTLVMTGLVLLVVAAVSGVYFAQLLQQVLDQTDKRAQEIASQVFAAAHRAVLNAPNEGIRPESTSPKDVHDYVAYVTRGRAKGLQAQLQRRQIGSSSIIYEVSITDHEGMVLVSTDDAKWENSWPGGLRSPSLRSAVWLTL